MHFLFIKAVESFFMKGSNGQLGSTGEVPLLENSKGLISFSLWFNIH